MSWAVGFDPNWQRDIGYGVPATCDHPDCSAAIDRGLAFVCGNAVYGGDKGCGLFFCDEHRNLDGLCVRCRSRKGEAPFTAKPDTLQWVRWKLRDESWRQWREENPAAVAAIREQCRHMAEVAG